MLLDIVRETLLGWCKIHFFSIVQAEAWFKSPIKVLMLQKYHRTVQWQGMPASRRAAIQTVSRGEVPWRHARWGGLASGSEASHVRRPRLCDGCGRVRLNRHSRRVVACKDDVGERLDISPPHHPTHRRG